MGKVLISQGWVQSEITVQTLYIIKKTKTKEGGGKDLIFSKVLEKEQVDFPRD